LSDCSDENFAFTDLGNLGLVGQYFQYKVSFVEEVAKILDEKGIWICEFAQTVSA